MKYSRFIYILAALSLSSLMAPASATIWQGSTSGTIYLTGYYNFSTQTTPTGFSWCQNFICSYDTTYQYNDATQTLTLLHYQVGTSTFVNSSNPLAMDCSGTSCSYEMGVYGGAPYLSGSASGSYAYLWLDTSRYTSWPFTPVAGVINLGISDSSEFDNQYGDGAHASLTTSISLSPLQAPAPPSSGNIPVPSPSSWLMMLTGLGILIPLYRRYVKAQRKGADGSNDLVV